MASQILTIRKPDDWHVHLRDGEMLQRGRSVHGAAVRAGDRDAQPCPAGDEGRRGARLPQAHIGGDTARLHAAHDLLSDGQQRSRRGRARVRGRRLDRGQALSRGRNHQQRERRDQHRATSTRCWSGCSGSAWSFASTAKSPTRTSTYSTGRRSSSRACCRRWSRTFPTLKIVLEHITTKEAVDFVRYSQSVGSDDHAAAFGHQPQRDLRRRLAAARLLPARRQARGASARGAQGRNFGLRRTFFLGTDSAPHARHAKESACGCAGIFNAPFALESYATRVRGRRRARQARGVRIRERSRVSMACRSTRIP